MSVFDLVTIRKPKRFMWGVRKICRVQTVEEETAQDYRSTVKENEDKKERESGRNKYVKLNKNTRN